MAIPELWALRGSRTRYGADGSAELIQEWHGPAGVSKEQRHAWMANFSGWKTVEFDEKAVTDTGDSVCLAEITWAVDPATGEPPPPGGDDYGLLRRTWRLNGISEQIPAEAVDRVQALAARDEAWPAIIRAQVESYKKRVKAQIDEWDPTSNTSPVLTEWDREVLWQPAGATSPEIGWAVAYANLLLREDNPVAPATQYVLSKVEQVTHWSTIAVSHLHVGRWMTAAVLATLEPTLTGSVATMIGLAALGDRIWMKQAPEVVDSSGGNVELLQEYYAAVPPPPGSDALAVFTLLHGDIITAL